MAKLVVLYPQPTDAEAFDKAYHTEHIPLFQRKMPGIRLAVTTIKGAVSGRPPYHLMAELWAPSIEALQAALGTPEAQEVVAHAFKISTGGPPTVLFAEEEIHEPDEPESFLG